MSALIYFSKVEFQELKRYDFSVRSSILLDVVQRKLSYYVYKYERQMPAITGEKSYEIDGISYSTDLIAFNSVVASNFETILFRALLIFLILFVLVLILKTINRPRKPRNSNYNYGIKHSKKSKRVKSKKGGRYKFTGLTEFL